MIGSVTVVARFASKEGLRPRITALEACPRRFTQGSALRSFCGREIAAGATVLLFLTDAVSCERSYLSLGYLSLDAFVSDVLRISLSNPLNLASVEI